MKKIITIFLLTISLGVVMPDVVAPMGVSTAAAQTRSRKKKKKAVAAPKAANTKSGNAKKGNTGKGNAKPNSTSKSSKPRTAAEVRKARQQNTAAIRQTRQKIQLNTKETEQRLNQLSLLEGEISNCNVNITALSAHIDSINRRIDVATDSINALNHRLANIRQSYVKAVRKTQGSRQSTSALSFIFSSNSFGQAYRRMQSLRQFSKWQKARTAEIGKLCTELDGRKAKLGDLKASAAASLGKLNGEKNVLVNKQNQTSQLVDRLKSEGAELNAIMERRQREAQSLDAELDRIIAQEAARQERLRREREAAERKAREEAEAKARQQAEAKAAAEREAAEKAEADRVAAAEAAAAQAAATEARKAKEAELAARARAEKAEKEAREAADKKAKKLAEKKAKQERAAAKKAERERVKAEREAAKRQAEAEKQLAQAKARAGKPVKHKGKNNLGTKTPAEASGATAERLSAPKPVDAPTGVASKDVNTDIGSDFGNARGRLPYPVAGRYTIVKRFGRQKHPTLPHVETNNAGIDMQTEPGATVRAVFSGVVSAVFRPDGYNTVVVIRHGKYMTVYANLGSISVSNGQKVSTGQAIGKVFSDPADANRSVLHFEIRNQRQKEDPLLWLR